MSENEKRKRLEIAKNAAVEVPDGMKRPPGFKMIGNAVVDGRLCIYYHNPYRYPSYYVRTIRCEKDLEPWR